MEINQIYRAPSLPKISRRNINSSLNRGALGSGISLKKSSFSFKQLTPKITPSKLVSEKSENQESRGIVKYIQSNLNIFKVLEESNKLLSQIREQLSLDYDERIKERNENLRLSKKRIAKNKINEKEKRIESRGKSLIGSALNTVIAPAKSIFQRILDFLSIIITGIVLNTAFKWLSEKENQEKLQQFFNFLKDYWKELLVVFGAVKLLGLVKKLYKIGRGLRSLFENRLKTPRVQPPKFPLEDLCAKLPNCIKEPSPELSSALEAQMQAAISKTDYKPIFTGIFNGLLGLGAIEILKQLIEISNPLTALAKASESSASASPLKPKETPPIEEVTKSEPTPLEIIRRKAIPVGVQEYVNPLLKKYYNDRTIFGQTKTQSVQTPMGQLIVEPTSKNIFTGDDTPKFRFISKEEQDYKAQQTQLMLDNPWIKTFFGAQTALDYAGMIMAGRPGRGVRPKSPFTSLRSANLSKFKVAVRNRLGQLKLKLPDRQADRVVIAAEKEVQSPAFHRALLQQRAKEGRLVVDENVVLDEVLKRLIQRELSGTSGGNLFVGAPKEVRQQLERIYANSPSEKVNVQPETQFRSMGGTVFGSGSQTVDSVPAMLAPGEEVIRSSAANPFRPLLKDINDNAGRLWKQFTEATINQEKINAVTRRSNRVFKDLITEFTELFDEEKREISKKNRKERAKTNPPSGDPPSGGGSPGLKSKITRPKRSRPKKMSGPSIPAPKFVSQNKQSPSRSHFSSVNNSIRQPVTNNIAKPVTNVKNIVQSPTSTTVVPFVIEKETGSPSVNVVNLAPKVLDLSKKSTPKPRTTQSDATSPIPSISPFDSNNDFNYTVPETLGILV